MCIRDRHAVVQVRKAQFRAIESVLSHFLSREIILAKLRNQRAVLLYFQKYQAKAFPEKAALFHLAMDRIEHLHDHLKTLDHLMQTDEWRTVLLGYEGQAADCLLYTSHSVFVLWPQALKARV